MTPGIRTDQPEIQAALATGAQLQSQTQLFFDLCPAKIIGVTGTKGKSTTASLIYHVLKAGGLPSVLAGNIGTPLLDILAEVKPETLVVAELSCHQLQHLTKSPHLAVIQNIAPEHLDYYPTFEAYVAAKSAIARFQTPADYVIFQRSFTHAAEVAALGQAQQLTYRIDEKTEGEPTRVQTPTQTHLPSDPSEQVWHADAALWLRQPAASPAPIKVIPTTDIPLLGHHNLYNVAPAILVAAHFGVNAGVIAQAIRSFQSLPHRLQKIATLAGIEYYDDSLSSNPHATVAALASFGTRPIVLIAGGYERHQDFQALAETIAQQSVKGLVLFPTTGERLWETVVKVFGEGRNQALAPDQVHGKFQRPSTDHQLPEKSTVTTMPEAVAAAQRIAHAQQANVILLSPASASFGLFADYHDRGVQFKATVMKSSPH